MTPSQAKALHAVADELEGFAPLPGTFKGVSAAKAAKITIRMAVTLLRERADNKPDTSRTATAKELKQANRRR